MTPKITAYVVVQKGDQYTSGHNYGILRAPSIARVGGDFDVAFNAVIGGIPSFAGIFVDREVTSPSSTAPVAIFLQDSTVTVVGLGTNITIGSISSDPPPAIGPGGHVAQTAVVTGGGIPPNALALLLKSPGAGASLASVCFTGQLVDPGVSTDTYGTIALPFALTANGEVGFRSTIASATVGDVAMVFADGAQLLHLVARKNDPAVGTVDKFNVIADGTNGDFVAKFDSMGRGAFRATTHMPGQSSSGIWVDGGSGVNHVADGLTIAPGYEPQDFAVFKAPAVASSGVVTFRACVDANCLADGVWRSFAGSLTLIAKDGSDAPNALGEPTSPNVEKFDFFNDPVTGQSGKIAFRAVLKQGDGEGIWRWSSPAGLRRIVKSGDSLRGTNFTFLSFDEKLAIADSGEIAFTATMSDGKKALLVTSDAGAIVKIAKVDDSFPIGAVDKDISAISFFPGSAAQGNGGFVQEIGPVNQVAAIAFVLSFTDMGQATILTTLE